MGDKQECDMNNQDYMDLQKYHDEKWKEVKKVLDRFDMFASYTVNDYEKAMGDIREIAG